MNRDTLDLVTDHEAPWSRDTDGRPLTPAEYEARYKFPGDDNWDRFPNNSGAAIGSRVEYSGPNALEGVLRDYGNQLDRVGAEETENSWESERTADQLPTKEGRFR